MHDAAFIESDICHCMAPFPKRVLCDIGLLFQGQPFQMLISRKQKRVRKMSNTFFIDADICHQNRTIAYIVLCDPGHHFLGQQLQIFT